MKLIKIVFYLVLALLTVVPHVAFGQSQPVYLTNYQQAREFALEHKKPTLYFITSDKNCPACNSMDSLLNTPEISSYLNENYINVKIDFLKPDGQYLFKKHSVRTLPTIIILDEDQMQVAVFEPDMESDDIFRYLRYVREPNVRDVFYRYALEQRDVLSDKKKLEAIYRSYSMFYGPFPDEISEKLCNQAVVHHKLRSGFAHEHVNKYLNSQVQLLTIMNLYFIMNFVDDTRSIGFKFLLNNKKSFIEAFGKEAVERKINSVINKRLYQIQPETGYAETYQLMALVSNIEVERRTYDYLIEQTLNKNRITDYLELQRKYISKFATRDHERMIKMIKVYQEFIQENYNASFYVDMARTAKKLSPDNLEYHIILTKLYIKNKDRENAMSEAISTLSLAKKLDAPLEPALELVLESQKMPEKAIKAKPVLPKKN